MGWLAGSPFPLRLFTTHEQREKGRGRRARLLLRVRLGKSRGEHNESACPQEADLSADSTEVRVGPEGDVAIWFLDAVAWRPNAHAQ